MNEKIFPLSMAKPGKKVVLVTISGGRGLRARLTSMGLKEGMSLKILQLQEAGPCVILAGETRLVLGHSMSEKIFVSEDIT